MKKLDKSLSKIFFNSVEEMNDCYGINAELPSNLQSNSDLVCYEIIEPFVFEYMGQYVLLGGWFYHLNNLGKPVVTGFNWIKSESDVHAYDGFWYEGRCFVYVRVNEYLRKHLEKTLIGCEFVCKSGAKYLPERRFVKNMSKINLVYDQYGFCTLLENILLYPDDHSEPIPYKEWVKKINEQDVEVEG